MKRFIASSIIIGMLFIPLVAKSEPTDFEVCSGFAELAEQAMSCRQENIDLQLVLGVIKKVNAGEAEAKLAKIIILEAYDSPRFHLEENRQDAIMEYKNKIFLQCMKARSK
jgi:hypothetical protein